jgi:CHASE2 domain-containing sensor protein
MKKILISPWTAIATLLLVLAAEISGPTFVESIKMRYFDTLITSKPITQNNIYTANIDEAALDKYGQWTFYRRTYAKIIKELYQHLAGLVVFDVLMP